MYLRSDLLMFDGINKFYIIINQSQLKNIKILYYLIETLNYSILYN